MKGSDSGLVHAQYSVQLLNYPCG